MVNNDSGESRALEHNQTTTTGSSFQSTVIKPKQKWSLWPVTQSSEPTKSQSKNIQVCKQGKDWFWFSFWLVDDDNDNDNDNDNDDDDTDNDNENDDDNDNDNDNDNGNGTDNDTRNNTT